MTALNSLEILKKFFGSNSSPGIALDMVRNGLFEEQLKLASQWGQSAQKSSPEGPTPMIKKTLPVGPPVPVQTPKQTDAPQRENKSQADSASPTSNAVSSPTSGVSEKPSAEPTKRELPSANTPPTGQSPTPTSGQTLPPDENPSPELADLAFSEGSSGSAEENSAGLSASALLTEISPKEKPTTEETSEETFQAVAAGEDVPLMVVPPQAPQPSEPTPPEAPSSPEQASSSLPVEVNPPHNGAVPKSPIPGALPADLLSRKEPFSESQTISHLAGTGSEQTGQSTAAGSQTYSHDSGPALPPGMNPQPETPLQAVAIPTTASPVVSEGASVGGGKAAVSGNVSTVGPESTSSVAPAANRGGGASSAANPTKAQSAADSEGSSQEASVQRVRFVQRVARAFQTLQDGGGSVRLRLHPPELGSLRMELTVRDGIMRARMEVENNAARTAILEHLPMLRERLAQQDIRIEQFEVEIGGDSSGAGSQQPGESMSEQQGSSFAPPTTRPRPTEPTLTPSGGNPLRASESTKLNVVI